VTAADYVIAAGVGLVVGLLIALLFAAIIGGAA
jgi:uncharacterized protein YacL